MKPPRKVALIDLITCRATGRALSAMNERLASCPSLGAFRVARVERVRQSCLLHIP
jgi:hypothetical protein